MKWGWVVCLALSLTVVSCAIEDGSPPHRSYDSLLADGQQALADGDGESARHFFGEALSLRPGDSTASLGLVLADTLQLVYFTDQIVSFVFSLSGVVAAEYLDDPGGLDPNGTLDDTIHHFLKHIFEPVLDELLLALDDALADPNLSLPLVELPISFQGEVVADLGGEWDATDAVWLAGTVRLVQGAVDCLQATNLDFDLGIVLETKAVRELIAGESLDWVSEIPELAGALAAMINDRTHPDALLPLPDEGWRFVRAQRNLALGVIYWVDVWKQVDAESDDPANEILGYEDRNGNQHREANEPYAWLGGEEPFPSWLMTLMPALLTIGNDLGGALAEGTDLDATSTTIESFDVSLLNLILETFGLPALVPVMKVNFAELFADPPAEEIKDFLTGALLCVSQEPGMLPIVMCVANLWE